MNNYKPGVPTQVSSASCPAFTVDIPKSATLQTQSWLTKRLDVLRSLWIKPLLWRYSLKYKNY